MLVGGPTLQGETPYKRWQLFAVTVGCDIVGGLGPLVTVGDNCAHQCRSLSRCAAAHNVYSGRVGVLVITLAGHPLVHLAVVGFAPARHRHVQPCAADVFTQHSVRGVRGGALASMNRDRIAVGDVVAQVVAAEGGAGARASSACGDPIVFGVDRDDSPPVAVADHVGIGRATRALRTE